MLKKVLKTVQCLFLIVALMASCITPIFMDNLVTRAADYADLPGTSISTGTASGGMYCGTDGNGWSHGADAKANVVGPYYNPYWSKMTAYVSLTSWNASNCVSGANFSATTTVTVVTSAGTVTRTVNTSIHSPASDSTYIRSNSNSVTFDIPYGVNISSITVRVDASGDYWTGFQPDEDDSGYSFEASGSVVPTGMLSAYLDIDNTVGDDVSGVYKAVPLQTRGGGIKTTTTVADPSEPGWIFKGYTFSGKGSWDAATKKYTYSDTVLERGLLTANWIRNIAYLDVDDNNGTPVKKFSQPMNSLQSIPVPSNGEKVFLGYSFEGDGEYEPALELSDPSEYKYGSEPYDKGVLIANWLIDYGGDGTATFTIYDNDVYSMDRPRTDIGSKKLQQYGDWFSMNVERIGHTPQGNANFDDAIKFDIYEFKFVGTMDDVPVILDMKRIDWLAYYYYASKQSSAKYPDNDESHPGEYVDADYAKYMMLRSDEKADVSAYGELAYNVYNSEYNVKAGDVEKAKKGNFLLVDIDDNANFTQENFKDLMQKYSSSGYASKSVGALGSKKYKMTKPYEYKVWGCADESESKDCKIIKDNYGTHVVLQLNKTIASLGQDIAIFEDYSQSAKASGYSPNNAMYKKYDNTWSAIIRDYNYTIDYENLCYFADLSSSSEHCVPLHDSVHRGGISFEIRDIDLLENGGASQGDGDLSGDTGSIFAIYNISGVYDEETGKIKYSDYSDPTGYIIPDRGYYDSKNNWVYPDNDIDELESTIWIPSYDPERIIAAYEKYLQEYSKYDTDASRSDSFSLQHAKVYSSCLDEIGLLTGIQNPGEGRDFACYTTLRKKYGNALNVDFTPGSSNIEFNIGKYNTDSIVPAMVVEAKNGMIDTGALALPVGTYMILQVKAGEGYYIDEDFRPIVSIGDWQGSAAGSGTSYVTDYHTSYDFKDNGAKANNDAAINSKYIDSAFDNEVNENAGRTVYPVRYVATYGTGSIGVTNISSSMSNAYTIIGSGAGTVNSTANGVYGNTFNYMSPTDTVTCGHYVQNDLVFAANNELSRLLKTSITRMALNKFTAYNAVVRSGSAYLLADSDDVMVNNGTVKFDANRTASGDLLIIPQGNGNLNGANFKVQNVSKHMVANVNGGSAIGVNGSAIYTVKDDKLVIPANELAYGKYIVTQISAGDGYDKEGSENILLASIDVKHEDKHTEVFTDSKGAVANRPDVNGKKYMTNEAIVGGDLEMIKSRTAEGMKAVVSIYNISDHYVYVDKNGDGVDHNSVERRTSIKELYDLKIQGKKLTFDEINEIINDYYSNGLTAENALCLERVVTIGTDLKSGLNVLPYGDYLMVLTEIPEDYEVVGQSYVVDSIEKKTDDVIFESRIEKKGSMPEIITEFVTAEYGMDSIPVDKGVVMKDRIQLQNLIPGQKYTAYGIIVDKSTGQMLPGCSVAYNSSIVAYKSTSKADQDLSGTANVEMLFDWINTIDMEGSTLVAYEYLCDYSPTGNPLALKATSVENLEAILRSSMWAEHNSLIDEAQTAYVPTLDVEAKASYSEGKVIDMTETVKAKIQFTNIEAGNTYIVKAKLYDAADNMVIIDNKEAEIATTFKAVNAKGSIDVVFKGLKPEEYNNERLTVYAELYRVYTDADTKQLSDALLVTKGDADSMGYDPTDAEPGKNQVDVRCPVIRTKFTSSTGLKNINFENKVNLVDVVSYSNLIKGQKYKSVLTVVDEYGALVYDDNNNPITAEVEFVAKNTKMKVEVPVSVEATNLIGMDLVAYNDLYKITGAVKLVGYEHEIVADQMIHATSPAVGIRISTIATDSETHSHYIGTVGTVTITDKVIISNVKPNTDYTIVTNVADAKTGAVISKIEDVQTSIKSDDDGDIITTVSIPIKQSYAGKSLVVYEYLYDKDMKTLIASEENNENKNQMIFVGKISTLAKGEDGSKTIPKAEKAVIVDTIEYNNLMPGMEYLIETTTSSGGTAKTLFTPDKSKGEVTVHVALNTSGLEEGKKITVFENISTVYNNKKVISHEDIDDMDQTVKVGEEIVEAEDGKEDGSEVDKLNGPPNTAVAGKNGPPKTSVGAPDTGVDQNWFIYLICGLITMIMAAMATMYKRHNTK